MDNLCTFKGNADQVATAIAAGASIADAAREAGIAARTVERWLARGRDGDPDYSAFAVRVDLARRRQSLDPSGEQPLSRSELQSLINRAARAGRVDALRIVFNRLIREKLI